MKNNLSSIQVIAILIIALAMQSCHSNNDPYNDVRTKKDTDRIAIDTSKIKIDTTGKAMDINAENTKDGHIMITIAATNYQEIKILKLALTKSIPGSLKNNIKRMMVDDETAIDSINKFAKDKSIVLPGESGVKAPDKYSILNKEDGDDFEKDFLSWIIADYNRALSNYSKYSLSANDPEITAWYNSTIQSYQFDVQNMQVEQQLFDRKHKP